MHFMFHAFSNNKGSNSIRTHIGTRGTKRDLICQPLPRNPCCACFDSPINKMGERIDNNVGVGVIEGVLG